MNKRIVFLITLCFLFSSLCCNAASEKPKKANKIKNEKISNSGLDKDTIFYPDANLKSAISKYKEGNYSGCLQELFSLTKMDPSNVVAYYYMAMAYTYVDMQDDAIQAYEKVISLDPNSHIASYATRGRDCLTGGPACATSDGGDLDTFINSPYGNGMSDQINEEVKLKELKKIKDTINKKNELENKDIEKIRKFDEQNADDDVSFEVDSIKIAQVSDEEILNAIQTLKDAGLNLTVQTENPYTQITQYQDPRMAEMSMLLGNYNNNNNNSMMNMLPMLMGQNQKGENIDPRVMQAMMMNSMMSDFGFTNNNNDRY